MLKYHTAVKLLFKVKDPFHSFLFVRRPKVPTFAMKEFVNGGETQEKFSKIHNTSLGWL